MILRRFHDWACQEGGVSVDAVTLGQLEAYQVVLSGPAAAGRRKLSWAVQALHLASLRTFLNWCHRQGMLEHNPALELRLPRLPKRLPARILNPEQAELVLQQPDLLRPRGLRDRAILEVLYSTGLRRLELIGLRLADIDPVRRVCFVREGKGGRDRVIPIGGRAIAWVHRYVVDERRELGEATDTLFLSPRGVPLQPSRLSDLVRRYFVLAGLGAIGSCHVFRHTVATLMLDGGADIRHVQAMLGHTDLRTTARYTQVAVASLQAVHARSHPGERAWQGTEGKGR